MESKRKRMFSSRIKWNLETNRLAKLLEEKRRSRNNVLDLTESNPTRVGFVYPVDEILSSLAQAPAMIYEPTPRGMMVTREAIAGYYGERGSRVDSERIHLTASTSEGYAYLFKLLVDEGRSVLVPQPSYPLFQFLAGLEGVDLRPYELSYVNTVGWGIDFNSIEEAIDQKTRAIIVVNPNNPTGSFVKQNELARLNEICVRHDLALIVDEVFADYAFNSSERSVASPVTNDSALTFVMSGLSKILALPQMKLGWIITNGPQALRDAAIERLDLIADTYLSVGAPVQHATPIWLRSREKIQAQILYRVRDNLRWLAERTEKSPCRLLKVEGGWYGTLELPRHFSEEEWVLTLLEQDDVLVHPGYFFDFSHEAFLILSLLPEAGVFQEAVNRLITRIISI
jgi:alanine-synthesizing transaminase